MKKKLVLLISTALMLGISACSESNALTEDCQDGAQKCEHNSVYYCNEGEWVLSAACGENVCNDTTYTCEAKVCSDGEKRCNANNVEICQNNHWKTDVICGNKICTESTSTCEVRACSDGEKRCNANNVEICNDEIWTIALACDDKTCNTTTHTCEVRACSDGEKRCNARAIEVCKDTVWTLEEDCDEKACNATTYTCEVNACNPGDTRCVGEVYEACSADGMAYESYDCAVKEPTVPYCHAEKICVECTKNEHCASNTCLSDNSCKVETICTPDAGRCVGEVYEECNKTGTAYEIIDCAVEHPKTPYCHPVEWCVECTKNSHCIVDGEHCNTTTNTCEVAPFEISWCKSQEIDVEGQKSYGQILDPRASKDPDTIDAMLLCGTAGTALNSYEMILDVSHNASCSGCGENFEYIADLSSLAVDDYLCIWSFLIDGATDVACQSDATIITDFDTIPTADTAQSYTVAAVSDGNYSIDFSGFKGSNTYANEETIKKDGLKISIRGPIYVTTNNIEDETLVIGDQVEGYVLVESETANASIGIGTLSFQFKTWNSVNFNDSSHKIEVFINGDESTSIHDTVLSGKYDTVQTVTIPIDQNVTQFKIAKKPITNKHDPRLLIDNIQWNKQP